MTLLKSSMLQKVQAGGKAILHTVSDVTDPIVHAIEQPVHGLFMEAQHVNQTFHLFHYTVKFATYYAMGWLAWTAFGDIFPREKRMVRQTVDRALKRARVR